MKRTRLRRPDSIIEDDWLGLGDLDGVEVNNPLLNRSKEDMDKPGLLEMRLMRDPNYIGFAAKVLLNVELLPMQSAILCEIWQRPFPMYIASRGYGKSFLLAVYAMLKCALFPNMKIVIVGAALRQSMVIWEYMDTIWKNAPILRSISDSDSGPRKSLDRCSVKINDSTAIAIPLGDGSKIRGLRAQIIICDEFNSIPIDIFETVVQGFAAVSANPIDNVKNLSRKNALKKANRWTQKDADSEMKKMGNQAIISGTPGYAFQPYADYWKKYWSFIHSRGEPNKKLTLPNGEVRFLKDFYPEGVPDAFDYRDFSVIRIPYEIIPKGYMDDKIVSKSKGTMHKAAYQQEYGALFPEDSDGFFKRTLLESCVASDNRPINLPSGSVWFDAIVKGDCNKKYVYGIDPAAEQDNFALIILELHEDHTRIVYVWSTNVRDFEKRRSAGMTKDTDYYGFIARKIRDLMKTFPTDDIGIDAQGGGRSVLESLHDKHKIEAGEVFLWPTNRILDPDKELSTDVEAGRHIVHMCQFANAEFTSDANHGTRKDFEDKVLLFPRFDPLTLELSAYADAIRAESMGLKTIYDSLEDCVMEVEDLKDELCTIVMTRTGTGVGGRDRWDTPETTTPEGKKTRMRKDRYSALMVANFIARKIHRAPVAIEYNLVGGFSHEIAKNKKKPTGDIYGQGPAWFTEGSKGFGAAISRINKSGGV